MNEIIIYDNQSLTYLQIDNSNKEIKIGPYTLNCVKGQWLLSDDMLKNYVLKPGYQLVHKPNTFYQILINYNFKKDKRYFLYYNEPLTINGQADAKIQFFDPLFKHFNFEIKNNLLKSNFDFVYVNNHRILKEQEIQCSDKITIGPLEFFYHERFILIGDYENNHDFKINLQPVLEPAKLNKTNNKEYRHWVRPHYLYQDNCPVFNYQFDFEDLKNTEIVKTTNGFSLLQGAITGSGLLIIGIVNLYIGKTHGRSGIELMQMMIMPVFMLIGTLCLPLGRYLYTRHQLKSSKRIYEDKIQSKLFLFEETIQRDLSKYQSYYHQFAFDNLICRQRFERERLYEIEKDDYGFGFLNMGETQTEIIFKYNRQDAPSLFNEATDKLFERYKSQKTFYLLKIFDYRFIGIKGSINQTIHYVLTLIAKLAISHSYNDLKMAVIIESYQKPYIKFIKNLQHFFVENHRLIFLKHDDLNILNHLDENLVVFDFTQIINKPINSKTVIFSVSSDNVGYKNYDVLIDLDNYTLNNRKLNQNVKIDYFKALQDYQTTLLKLPDYYLNVSQKTKQPLITLFDMYQKDLDLGKRYRTLEDKATILIGKQDNGSIFKFDLSEQGIGPHLLITGATGSGKSELILTILLGIALNFNADEASIALIDYKGTGLKETLSYNKETLPHLALSLTNLNPKEFNRSLMAFKAELLKREKLFKRLSELSAASIMNLRDYRLLNKEYQLEDLSEFFIVIDEFAELKKDRPEFMHEINRIARVGRSLGFHLILATQKLGGVIDQEIAANLSARIALKTNNVEDSYETIQTKDAFTIKHPGEFYLLSQNGLQFGQAIYTRANVDLAANQTIGLVDYKMDFIIQKKTISLNQTRQISYFVKKIIDYHNAIGFKPRSIFLKPLTKMTYEALHSKLTNPLKKGEILLGEDDDYVNMSQSLLIHDLKKEPYLAFYTNDFSRIKFWLNNLIASLKANDYHRILLTCNKDRYLDYERYLEIVDAQNTADLTFLINQIKLNHKDILLIIDDFEILKSNETFLNSLIKLMFRTFNRNLAVQLFLTHGQKLAYRFAQLFRIYSDYYSQDELLNLYGCNNEFGEDFVYKNMQQRLIGFCLAQSLNVEGTPQTEHLIYQIPKKRSYICKDGYLNLGYAISTRQPYYVKENACCLFVSWYDELLNNIQKLIGQHPHFTYANYHNIKSILEYEYVIWIGPKLKEQFLFIPDIKQDLSPGQAYIYGKGQKEVIELVNE